MDNNKKYLNELKDNLTHYKKELSAVGNSFKGKADKKNDKLVKALEESFTDASEAYEKLSSASAEEWESLKKVASKAFDQLKGSFDDLADVTSDQVKDLANYIEERSEEVLESGADYIKNNPFKSILLAGGLGIIIGRVFK